MDRILGLRPVLFYASVAVGLGYGLFARFVFGLDQAGDLFEIMSLSFIFVVPIVIGFLTIFLWPSDESVSPWNWITYPWATAALVTLTTLALAWEGVICAIVWMPIFFVMSSLGGTIAGIIRRIKPSSASRSLVLTSAVVLPFLLSPIEQQVGPATLSSVAKTEIEIKADAATIWDHIKAVDPIGHEEQGFSIAHAIGFPKPIAAELIGEGVGALRHATFEGDVLFVETVTEWVPLQRLSFSIEPAPDIPPTTFDEHVVVGGAYFDVLTGTYWLEKIGPENYVLHLSSEHRLATRFNWYTRLWTDFFMNDIQKNILEVIKKRSEEAL